MYDNVDAAFAATNIMQEKLDLIWQMGLASLSETDNELRLPVSVSGSLTRDEIVVLENRLAEHLEAPVVSFKDLSMNIYRILRMPEMQRLPSSPAASVSSVMSSVVSTPSDKVKDCTDSPRRYGKKSKIPRPPNAFILYRQKYHPILKAQDPELHNNSISIILGQQWKNEDPATRDKFKMLAEELKRQHHVKFPGYQYAPRKPSEKKRRMTARKAAKQQEYNTANDTSEFPILGDHNMGHNVDENSIEAYDEAMQSELNSIPSLEEMFGLNVQNNTFTTPTISSEQAIREVSGIFSLVPGQQPFNAGQIPAPATFAPLPYDALLNSLVDWELLQDINGDGADDTPEAAQVQNDHPHLGSVATEADLAFKAELERVMGMLE